MNTIRIGVLREEKIPHDKRVPFVLAESLRFSAEDTAIIGAKIITATTKAFHPSIHYVTKLQIILNKKEKHPHLAFLPYKYYLIQIPYSIFIS